MPKMEFESPLWFSPISLFRHISVAESRFGKEKIEQQGRFKVIREARVLAQTTLVIYALSGKPTYGQFCRSDPPDAYLMQESSLSKGTIDYSALEISTFRDGKGEGLFDQLKRTKFPIHHKYSEGYIVAIEVLSSEVFNFSEMHAYLKSIHAPYRVWILRPIAFTPDTIIEVTELNPEFKVMVINLGKAAHEFIQSEHPDVVVSEVIKGRKLDKITKKPSVSDGHKNTPWRKTLNEF